MKNITFREMSELWFKNTQVSLTYTYIAELKSMINHLNLILGDKMIDSITTLDIGNMIVNLSIKNPNTQKPASKSFLTKIVNVIFNIFELAVDSNVITKNPAKGKKFIPKNAPQKEVGAISKNEQKLIINTEHRCQIAAMIMMFAGLRVSELLALEWSNIDFNNKQIKVKQHAVRVSANKYEIQRATKNGTCRNVTIPKQLILYLLNEKKKATSSFVFPKKDGTLNTPSSWRSAWVSYNNTLNYQYYLQFDPTASKYDPKGIPKLININAHQLRHTYATLLYVSQTDILTAKNLLGHSTVQLTLDTYTHLDQEYKKLDISNFDRYLLNNFLK